MAFIDEVVIRVIAGSGGKGCLSFRREKYVPRGGPDGGNGGSGGSVYLLATRNKGSLLDFKYQPKFEADRGQHGKGSDMDGRAGEDLVLPVPVGTLVYDEEGTLLHDLTEDGKSVLVACGGRGGRGNKSFVSSTNRAPRMVTPGRPGQTRELRLELRLIADVGLVGLPNAGKSSFLRRVSRAEPKVADYPFTTLEPALGVVYHKDQTIVMADLPGLIEGASEGAGLGHRFLRHVGRTRVLLHLVDLTVSVEEMLENVATIRHELAAYDSDLLGREQLLVFTKADTLAPDALQEKMDTLKEEGLSGFAISSQSGYGIDVLLDNLLEKWIEKRGETSTTDVASQPAAL